MKSVAVIGLGAMGGPMARRVRAAGYDVLVCDRNPDVLRAFEEEGCSVTSRASDCATAEAVLVIVANAAQAEDVILGPDGVLAGGTGDGSPLIVLMSTVGMESVHRLAAELSARGVAFLDAPISGGKVRAEAGTLAMLVGGDPDVVQGATPLLATMGSAVFPCGPVGSAQEIKLINNVIGSVNTVMVSELYRLALEHGMTVAQVTSVLEAGTGRSWLSTDPDEVRLSFAKFTETRAGYDAQMTIMRKDFDLARALLAGSGASYPVLDVLLPLLHGLGDETFDNWSYVGAAEA